MADVSQCEAHSVQSLRKTQADAGTQFVFKRKAPVDELKTMVPLWK